MKLSELVRWSGKRRQVFHQVAHVIETSKTYADEDEARTHLAEECDETSPKNKPTARRSMPT